MNIALWIVQVLLAAAFIFADINKAYDVSLPANILKRLCKLSGMRALIP